MDDRLFPGQGAKVEGEGAEDKVPEQEFRIGVLPGEEKGASWDVFQTRGGTDRWLEYGSLQNFIEQNTSDLFFA